MDVSIASESLAVSHRTRALLEQTFSPLCGLNQRVSFMLRSRDEPRLMTAGAELTGVHVLRGQPRPKVGVYHIGGSGVVLDEALIRALGETIERYAQLVAEIRLHGEIVWASYETIADRGEPVVRDGNLIFFSDAQHARPDFPFQPFSRSKPLGWIRALSLVQESPVWAPAQLLLVGYRVRRSDGEPWLLPAVTTGSAAHTDRRHALRNALLELVQIDAAMGHWYSAAQAPEILLDQRTAALGALLTRHFPPGGPVPRFYWLPSPDLPGFTVACVLRRGPGEIPVAAVGLGCDLRLVDALYKAVLEATGVAQLAKITLFDQLLSEPPLKDAPGQAHGIFDLDQNVALYARPGNGRYIDEKFGSRPPIPAGELPPDALGDTSQDVRLLVEGFRGIGKELLFLDLTTPDIRELGFTALRVWSPDTLSLPLPSAPPALHPRFRAYGGFSHDRPHPYP